MTESKTLYYSIEKDIKERVHSGEYKAGDPLPTESEMCKSYSVSRVTVRKAIEALIEDGVVERAFSKTPRIKQDAVPRSINRMSGLSEDLAQSGIKCSTFILQHEIVEADDSLARKLDLEEGAPLHLIERLRYANGNPLCYQKLYLNDQLCSGLDPNDLVSQSLYYVLETQYGLKIKNCTQKISSCLSSYRICALLELKEATAMLRVSNQSYLDTGACFEYSENYYVGGSYQVSVVLTR